MLAVLLGVEDNARQIFEVHLVANAGVRRNHFEILEGLLSPAQEGVAFDVALHLEIGIEGEGAGRAEFVHLYGMVDHQFRRQQRIDLLRVAAELADRVAHRGEVHHRGHAREILQQNARRHERHFFLHGIRWVPAREGGNVAALDEAPVFVAQQIFEQHLQRKGKARYVADAGLREGVQAVNFKRLVAHAQCGEGRKGVLGGGAH